MLALVLVLAGCAGRPLQDPPARVATDTPQWFADRALGDRILALDPQHVSDADVRETLANGPTPRIMLLHGGIYPVHL